MVKMIKALLLWILVWMSGCHNHSQDHVYTGVLEGKLIQVPVLTPGLIVDLKVDRGQEVSRGDTLAIIDSTDLILQLNQLKAGLKENQVQSEISMISLQRAESDLDYIREKYQRMEKLVANQSMPQQNLDDLNNQLERARLSSIAARQAVQRVKAKAEQINAQIQSIQKRIFDCTIISPAQGIISNTYYEQAEAIPLMNPIVEILHIRSLEVKIYIAEKTLPQISYGQTVRIRVNGLEEEIQGTVSWISSKAEFTPKTILTPETRSSLVYAVNIAISNSDGLLKHGMPVEVVF